jgi:glycosyltransferase involved in cell wall biosynthesis
VLQLRNESAYLEGCLAHLRDHVDGFIALDDGSTDDTPRILRAESRLLDCITHPARPDHVWNELENKRQLLQRAKSLGADWVLCCDADERYETAFLQRLHGIAGRFPAASAACFYVKLRELWDTPAHYRVDGIWGEKARARFFSLPEAIEYGRNPALHGEWFPEHTRRHGRMLHIDHNLYHLKTIRREDRIRRRDFYKRLDPHNRFQSMGYDYLAEEGEGLALERIAAGREYDFSTLPDTLKPLLPAVPASR